MAELASEAHPFSGEKDYMHSIKDNRRSGILPWRLTNSRKLLTSLCRRSGSSVSYKQSQSIIEELQISPRQLRQLEHRLIWKPRKRPEKMPEEPKLSRGGANRKAEEHDLGTN